MIVVGDRTYEMFPVEPSPLCRFNTDGSMVVNGASADYDISDLYSPIGKIAYLLIQSNDWEPPAEGETGFVNYSTISVIDLDSGESFVADITKFVGFVAPGDTAILESNLGDGRGLPRRGRGDDDCGLRWRKLKHDPIRSRFHRRSRLGEQR